MSSLRRNQSPNSDKLTAMQRGSPKRPERRSETWPAARETTDTMAQREVSQKVADGEVRLLELTGRPCVSLAAMLQAPPARSSALH